MRNMLVSPEDAVTLYDAAGTPILRVGNEKLAQLASPGGALDAWHGAAGEVLFYETRLPAEQWAALLPGAGCRAVLPGHGTAAHHRAGAGRGASRRPVDDHHHQHGASRRLLALGSTPWHRVRKAIWMCAWKKAAKTERALWSTLSITLRIPCSARWMRAWRRASKWCNWKCACCKARSNPTFCTTPWG